jgi:multidrug efflux pump
MSIGTFFTLFIVPSIYMLIAKDHKKQREQEKAAEKDAEVPAGAEPAPAE